MKLYKKTGTVLTGKITGTHYVLRKKCGRHNVSIMRIVGSKEGLVLDHISSHGVANYYPDDFNMTYDTLTSTFRNKSYALEHIQRLEREHYNSEEYIESMYTGGLLTKEEFKERLALANA